MWPSSGRGNCSWRRALGFGFGLRAPVLSQALHSEKLKSYFEDHPEEKRALQRTVLDLTALSRHFAALRMQRQLRENKSIRAHLKSASIPAYPRHSASAVASPERPRAVFHPGAIIPGARDLHSLHAGRTLRDDKTR